MYFSRLYKVLFSKYLILVINTCYISRFDSEEPVDKLFTDFRLHILYCHYITVTITYFTYSNQNYLTVRNRSMTKTQDKNSADKIHPEKNPGDKKLVDEKPKLPNSDKNPHFFFFYFFIYREDLLQHDIISIYKKWK